jgi:glycosyltransferase involved in cell wall biosynthesis
VRVIHVLAPAPFGGLEQVVLSLAVEQRAEGKSAHVAELVETGGAETALAARLRTFGVDVHTLAYPPRSYRSQFSALRRLVKSVAPDVIHSHGYVSDVLAAVIKSVDRGQRLVSTVHGFTGGDWKNRLYERLQRRAFRRFDAVVGVSRRLSTDLIESGLSAARVHTIPNAWRALAPPADRTPARRALGVPGDVFSLGWVGRVSYEKGLDVLVKALPQLVDIPLRLTVVGDGVLRASVQESADRLGVASRISWAGVVDDAAHLMRAFDLLVISSRTEGTPMNLLEAMGAGVPVLTTSVGGIPDVVSDAEAMLVAPDDPIRLAGAIREIYGDPKAGVERAERARERVRSVFGVTAWLKAYDRVYASL